MGLRKSKSEAPYLRTEALVGVKLCSACDLELQIIEIGHGIRFGPKSDPAGCEGLITEVKHRLVIKKTWT